MKNYLIYCFLILALVGFNTITYKYLKQRRIWWLVYGLSALCVMLVMWTISEPQVILSDFGKAYYPAGRLILENPDELYNKPIEYLSFVNIPIVAFLFTPISLLPSIPAKILFTIVGSLAIFTSCYLLLKLTKVSGWKRVVLIGLFVVNGPLYNSFREGNLTHFVLLLLVGAVFCIKNKHKVLLGVILAIAAIIKIPLFLLGVYFAIKRQWQATIGFIATLLVIVGASVLLMGIDLHLFWLQQCIKPFAGKYLTAFNVQSVSGFLARVLTKNTLIRWQPIEVGWEFKILYYGVLMLLIGGSIWICWRSIKSNTSEISNLEFSIFLCLALVTSPICWTHYYLLLLIPIALYLGNGLAVPNRPLWNGLFVLSVLLMSPSVTLVESQNLFIRLLISHYFFGGILLLGILLAARQEAQKRLNLSLRSHD